MRISLIPREIIDIGGVPARLREDIRQLQLPQDILDKPEGFKDWGLVWFEGIAYYMASYNPPQVEFEDEL